MKASPKTALITGSYGGLGTEFVKIHALTGGNVILAGKNLERLEAQKEETERIFQVHAEIIPADLSKTEDVEKVYSTCLEKGWKVDYLINNAGFGGQGDFARERSMEDDMSMIAVNIECPTRLCKRFLPDFVKRGSGKVLNVSSIAANVPGPLQAVYFATKAYLTSWSNALWRELRGTGVTVTCLMPGPMRTGFISTGKLEDTKLFSHCVLPDSVARDGYNAMLKGKMDCVSGLLNWEKPFLGIQSLYPKKMIMNFVYDWQIPDKAETLRK